MALSSKGECTCQLNVSGYGLGENVTVSYRAPKPVSASAIDGAYEGYTIVDIDAAPMLSGAVRLTQTVGDTETEIVDEGLSQGYYWGFNVFSDYCYAEQEYDTIGAYRLFIERLTYSYVVLADYSVEPPVTVHLGTTVIGSLSEPAVDDRFVYASGAESDAYGDRDRSVLFIPYKNER